MGSLAMDGHQFTELYEESEALGKGSFSDVVKYGLKRDIDPKAVPQGFPKHMAVKKILRRHEFALQTHKEIETLRRAQHVNVVRLLVVHDSDEFTFIGLELCDLNLRRFVKNKSFDRQADSTPLFLQICCGLDYLHSAGIAHRDIKPDNILIKRVDDSDKFVVKLADFGLAKATDPNLSAASMTAQGTEKYMSPEVARAFFKGRRAGGDAMAADVFSVGVVFYEVMFESPPFKRDELTRGNEPPTPVHLASAAEDPTSSETIIRAMLQWDKKNRPKIKEVRMHFITQVSEALLASHASITTGMDALSDAMHKAKSQLKTIQKELKTLKRQATTEEQLAPVLKLKERVEAMETDWADAREKLAALADAVARNKSDEDNNVKFLVSKMNELLETTMSTSRKQSGVGYVANGVSSDAGDPTMPLFRRFVKTLEESKQFLATHALHVPLQYDKDVQLMENSLRKLTSPKDVHKNRIYWHNYFDESISRLDAMRASVEAKLERLQPILEKGAVLVGRGGDLNAELAKRSHTEVFVLFFRWSSAEESSELWAYFEGKLSTDEAKHHMLVDAECAGIEINADCVRHYRNGHPVKDDAVMNAVAVDERCCLAKPVQLESKRPRPTLTAPFEAPCPRSLDDRIEEARRCPAGRHSWKCTICVMYLEYGFDGVLYCDCGGARAWTFECSAKVHGTAGFGAFPDGLLNQLVNGLRTFDGRTVLVLGEPGAGRTTLIAAMEKYTGESRRRQNSHSSFSKRSSSRDSTSSGDAAFSLPDPSVVGHVVVHKNIRYRFVELPSIRFSSSSAASSESYVQSALLSAAFFEEVHSLCVVTRASAAGSATASGSSDILSPLETMLKSVSQRHLHASAAAAFVFCVTGARNVLFQAAEIVSRLKRVCFNSPLAFTTETIFCVENEAVTAAEANGEADPDEVRARQKTFAQSRAEAHRMLDYMASTAPARVRYALDLEQLAAPLAAVLADIQSRDEADLARRKDVALECASVLAVCADIGGFSPPFDAALQANLKSSSSKELKARYQSAQAASADRTTADAASSPRQRQAEAVEALRALCKMPLCGAAITKAMDDAHIGVLCGAEVDSPHAEVGQRVVRRKSSIASWFSGRGRRASLQVSSSPSSMSRTGSGHAIANGHEA